MGDSGMARLSVGARVIDTEDDDPSVGIVVARPSEQTIADWEFSTNDGTKTTADTNQEYPADTQLVIVAFKTALNEYWSEWEYPNNPREASGRDPEAVHSSKHNSTDVTASINREKLALESEKIHLCYA